jgi:hypothetical protein
VIGQHLPPDYAQGDESTVGGYAAVHSRPAAFAGTDGTSYTVDILADVTGTSEHPWAAYLFFVRWSAGAPALEGHLESDYVARGVTEADARAAAGRLSLREAKRVLDELILAEPQR